MAWDGEITLQRAEKNTDGDRRRTEPFHYLGNRRVVFICQLEFGRGKGQGELGETREKIGVGLERRMVGGLSWVTQAPRQDVGHSRWAPLDKATVTDSDTTSWRVYPRTSEIEHASYATRAKCRSTHPHIPPVSDYIHIVLDRTIGSIHPYLSLLSSVKSPNASPSSSPRSHVHNFLRDLPILVSKFGVHTPPRTMQHAKTLEAIKRVNVAESLETEKKSKKNNTVDPKNDAEQPKNHIQT